MSARKPKPPSNVVSLAAYRKRNLVKRPPSSDGEIMHRARVIAEFASSLGVDLQLVAAIQRGDVPPVA